MLKVECTVYLGEEELFVVAGDGQLDAATKAAKRIEEDYSDFLSGELSWDFERIYPKKELFVPPSRDGNFIAFVKDLRGVRDRIV